MLRIGLFLLAFTIAMSSHGNSANAGDEFDVRLAKLEKENQDLKKRLRIEALEQENAALSKKLASVSTREFTAQPEVSRKERIYNTPSFSSARAQAFPSSEVSLESRSSFYSEHEFEIPRSKWAGAYVGAHAGMGFGSWPTSFSSSNNSGFGGAPVNETTKVNAVGAVAGLHAGYLWQVGSVVFGPEIDLSTGTIGAKKNASYNPGIPGGAPSAPAPIEATVRWLSTVRGRIGFTSDDWMVFGTGGLALTNLDMATNFLFPNISTTEFLTGYAVGGGLERALGANMRLRAEYLYLGFPNKTLAGQVAVPPSTYISSLSVRPSTSVVRAGIDWYLN